MASTFFGGGTIWTGVDGQTTDALLVVDGVVAAVGELARERAAGAEDVELGGGFLMPSFGDGHAHPLPGGLEAVGPQVRPCKSVDEIVEAVRKFAVEHPDEEWIVGASYESSLAPGGLFDARWLDAAVPDRPVVLRAWDYHTVWCNSVALDRAGITADTPDPEHVATTNGPRDRRPVIAHAQLVDDADLGRFAELGVISNMQPLWAQLDPLMVELTVPRLGPERTEKQYRMRSLIESGAPLAFGSDWPVSSGAPLGGIAVAVSRRTADGDPQGGWTPQEILPIERALSAYTSGVAHQAFAEGKWGAITPGASADLVWLDSDPRTTPPLEIPAIRVRATYLTGRPVYSATG